MSIGPKRTAKPSHPPSVHLPHGTHGRVGQVLLPGRPAQALLRLDSPLPLQFSMWPPYPPCAAGAMSDTSATSTATALGSHGIAFIVPSQHSDALCRKKQSLGNTHPSFPNGFFRRRGRNMRASLSHPGKPKAQHRSRMPTAGISLKAKTCPSRQTLS